MKLVKNLLLGSAAGLVGTGVVAAADLPVKAKPIEYVKVCSLYGAGFYYIPGTDTCVKLGGYLRVDTTFNGGSYGQPFYAGDGGQGSRFHDSYLSRSRMGFDIDTRTATEYGVVRTFGHANLQFNNFGTSNPAVLTAPGVNSNLLNTRVGDTSRSTTYSYSSPASRSENPLPPMRLPGMVTRVTTRRS